MFLITLLRCLLFSATLFLATSLAMLKNLMTGSKDEVEVAERDYAWGDEIAVATDLAVLLGVARRLDVVPQAANTIYLSIVGITLAMRG